MSDSIVESHKLESGLIADAHRLAAEVTLVMLDEGEAHNICEMHRQLFLTLRLFAPSVFEGGSDDSN